jgi:peptidoglycan/LPS O-acetylase OafA/YrhL
MDGALASLETYLSAYPFATLSSAGFYGLLISLAVPSVRRVLVPYLGHPVAPNQHYLQAFDTFRGFAAALVAIGHCWWATHPVFHATQKVAQFIAFGQKAVPMFAVLSGFLIYRSVLSIRSVQDLRAYVIRRAFRIYPVYLLGVGLAVVCGQYISGQHVSPLSFLVSDVLMLNIVGWPGGFANPVTWSLYIEVMFYAFLPLAFLTLGRRHLIQAAAIGLLALLAADYPSRVFGLWKFFLIGILASEFASSISFAKLNQRHARIATLLLGLGVGLLIYDFGGMRHDWVSRLGLTTAHGEGNTVGLGLACFLILVSVCYLPRTAAILNVLPLRLLGVISYSVYIVHFFYIYANFPELGSFSRAGTPQLLQHFESLPQMPAWYLPVLFFPGIFFWSVVAFLLVERPGIQLGKRIVDRMRAGETPLHSTRTLLSRLHQSRPSHDGASGDPAVPNASDGFIDPAKTGRVSDQRPER